MWATRLARRTSTAAGWGGWGAGRAVGFHRRVLDRGRNTTPGQDASAKPAPPASPPPYPAAVDVLTTNAEVDRVGRARGVRDRHAEDHADAHLAERALEDVGAVAGRVHPGGEGAARRAVRAGAPGQVLAQHPAVVLADVLGAQDAVDHRDAVGRRVLEERVLDHVARVTERGLAQPLVLAQRRQVVLGTDLVVQAEDRGPDLAHVLARGLEI